MCFLGGFVQKCTLFRVAKQHIFAGIAACCMKCAYSKICNQASFNTFTKKCMLYTQHNDFADVSTRIIDGELYSNYVLQKEPGNQISISNRIPY